MRGGGGGGGGAGGTSPAMDGGGGGGGGGGGAPGGADMGVTERSVYVRNHLKQSASVSSAASRTSPRLHNITSLYSRSLRGRRSASTLSPRTILCGMNRVFPWRPASGGELWLVLSCWSDPGAAAGT